MSAVEQLAPVAGLTSACRALRVPRATLYRRRQRQEEQAKPKQRQRPPRRISDEERGRVLDELHSERFIDTSPGEIWATLLDEEKYLCSERSMYRILSENQEVRERRNQLRHPQYTKPELLATAPNQVWSWDITKLRGPVKWTYYYLYVLLDIYSRYVVAWLLADRESGADAKRMIEQAYQQQNIKPGQVTIHADRGPAPAGKVVAQLLADLGLTKSHSRPHVSNDNPYSESQFKTMKYRPEFPDRFGSMPDTRGFCRVFFPWYNNDHRHSGIAMLTPEMAHYGLAEEVLAKRHQVLLAAYAAHPERFPHGPPRQQQLPPAAWINPPSTTARTEEVAH
jgi:putative transposase